MGFVIPSIEHKMSSVLGTVVDPPCVSPSLFVPESGDVFCLAVSSTESLCVFFSWAKVI